MFVGFVLVKNQQLARHLTKEKLSKEESSDFIKLTGTLVEENRQGKDHQSSFNE
ncbi:hypothetical protein BRE01_63060 [Brevibacillus reuszeri]|uniref:Uncharacterized protein n=1 Tax=Brevibacillus reuszeri TaxID=54915 RepID=A0ABQ0TXT2_9BACL|nr:hypothetical protein BRE01_63060 [Brevibacillus reuszeri]